MAIITVRPPTEAEKKLFSQVDTSKLPQPSVSITPSGSKKLSSGYIPGGATTTGGGSRSRIPAKPVTYSSTILQQSFTSIEARDRAEREFFEQQKQQVTSVVAPTQKRLDIVTPVKKEDVYREPILTRIKKSAVGQRISGIGTGLSTVGKQIYEIGIGTTEEVKDANVTPRSAYFGLRYDLSKTELGSVDWKEEELDLGLPQPVKAKVPVPRYTDEQLSATRTGAEILIERDKDLLTQDLLTKSDNLIKQEQEKLNNIVSNEISKFETKWASNVSGNQFIGTKKEYEQYQRESKELENVIEIEQRKSNQRYDKIFDLESTKLISEFEKKSGKRISKGEITQTIGRAPIYAGIGALTAGVAPAIVGGSAIATGTLKTIGLVGLGATAVTGYVKGLEGDYTSVAKLGIITGASLAGGLAYKGGKVATTKVGDMVYTRKLVRLETPKLLDKPFIRATLSGKKQLVFMERVEPFKLFKISTWKYKGLKPGTFYKRQYRIVDPLLEGQTKGLSKVKYYGVRDGKVVLIEAETTPFPFDKPSKHLSWFLGKEGGVQQYYLPKKFLPQNVAQKVKGFGFSATPNKWVEGSQVLDNYQVFYSGKGASVKFFRLGDKYNIPSTSQQGVLPKRPTLYASYFEKVQELPGKEVLIKNPLDPSAKGWKQYLFPKKTTPGKLYLTMDKPEVQGVVTGGRLDLGKDLWFEFGGRRIPIETGAYFTQPSLTQMSIPSSKLTPSKISYLPTTPSKVSVISSYIPSSYLMSRPTYSYPVSRPTYSYPMSKPTYSYPVSRPTYSYPMSKPTYSYPVSRPTYSYPVSRPTYSYPVSRPTYSYPMSKPTYSYPVSRPTYPTPKTDSLKFGKKGKVFKQKGLTKMYQASLGAIALDYGITRYKFKNYKGKPFTGTELRPFVLKNNK